MFVNVFIRNGECTNYYSVWIIRHAVPLGCKPDTFSSMPLYSKNIPHITNMSIHTRMLNTVSIPLNTTSMPHNTVGVALSAVNMPLSIPLYGRNIPHINYILIILWLYPSEHCEHTSGYCECATGYHEHTSWYYGHASKYCEQVSGFWVCLRILWPYFQKLSMSTTLDTHTDGDFRGTLSTLG